MTQIVEKMALRLANKFPGIEIDEATNFVNLFCTISTQDLYYTENALKLETELSADGVTDLKVNFEHHQQILLL